MLLKIVCLLTCRVLGLVVLVFRGDRAKLLNCWCSGTRTRCCAATSAAYGTSRPAGRVGFQNSASSLDLVFYAARSYSLMKAAEDGPALDPLLSEVCDGVVGPGRAGLAELAASVRSSSVAVPGVLSQD